MKKLFIAAALWLVSLLLVRGASISWTSGGDGLNWSDPLNWTGGVVPASSDDAVLGPGSTVVIAGNNFSVLSIQSQRPISITGGSLAVNAGSSEVKGTLSLAPGAYITANGLTTSFLCTNTVTADGAGFYVQNGAVLRVPGLRNYSRPDGFCSDAYWYANGAGSVLDLSGVTNAYAGNCSWLRLQAIGGGQVILSNLVTLTNGNAQAYANGAGSLIDLHQLAVFPGLAGWLDLQALNDGQVTLPLLVDGSRAGFTLANGGLMNLSQLTHVGFVSVDSQAVTFPSVTNLDGGINLYVYNTGYLSFPLVQSYSKTDGCYDVYWYANGSSAVLDFSSLTNIPYGGNNCGWIRAQGVSGGRVILSNLLSVASTTLLQAYANGVGSLVDLRQLGVFPSGSGWLDLQALNGGQVSLPLLVDGIRAGFTLANGGIMNLAQLTRVGYVSVDSESVTFPAVTNVDGGVNLNVYNTGYLSLPQVRSYSKVDGCYDVYWYANGSSAVLDLSALTSVPYGGNNCGWLRAQAFGGGQVILSNLVSVATNTPLQAYANGNGGLVDLRQLAVFPGLAGWLDLQALNGGQVLLPLLVDGVRAGFTLVNGGVLNVAQLTRVGYVYVDSQSVAFPLVTNIDGGVNLNVYNTGYLSLPLVRSYSKLDGCYDVYWYANGGTAVLDLSAITNLPYGGNNCGYVRAQAFGGGSVVLSNLVAMATNTLFQAYANGAGSSIDLRRLAAFPNLAGWLDLQAINGGTVLLPLLVDGSRAGVTLIGGGTMNLNQLTRVGYVYVDGQSVTFPAVTNVDGGVNLNAYNGAHLSLPQVRSYTKTDGCYDTYWYAWNSGSVLDLSGITNLYAGDCGYLRMQAFYGGQIIVSNLVSVPDGYLQARSQYTDNAGTNSIIDLRHLSQFSTPDRWFDLSVYAGGQVILPSLVDGRRVGLSLWSGGVVDYEQFARLGGLAVVGTTNNFPVLTNLDGSNLSLNSGAQVTLPVLAALTKIPGCYNELWQASDPGSLLLAPALTTIASLDSCGRLDLQATSGGTLLLSNLTSLAGPAVNLLVDGAASTLDVSRLNSFIAPNNQPSSLTAQNSGVLLLGSQAFLLANVNVNIPPGNPVLPPSLISGPNLTLYGLPWHSYLVEDRSALDLSDSWDFFLHVPLTNALQQIYGPPPADTAFRVSELLADPADMDFFQVGGGETQLILYGLTNQTYQLQTSTNLADPGSWTLLTTITLSNTFRIFPPASANDPVRFFRVVGP